MYELEFECTCVEEVQKSSIFSAVLGGKRQLRHFQTLP